MTTSSVGGKNPHLPPEGHQLPSSTAVLFPGNGDSSLGSSPRAPEVPKQSADLTRLADKLDNLERVSTGRKILAGVVSVLLVVVAAAVGAFIAPYVSAVLGGVLVAGLLCLALIGAFEAAKRICSVAIEQQMEKQQDITSSGTNTANTSKEQSEKQQDIISSETNTANTSMKSDQAKESEIRASELYPQKYQDVLSLHKEVTQLFEAAFKTIDPNISSVALLEKKNRINEKLSEHQDHDFTEIEQLKQEDIVKAVKHLDNVHRELQVLQQQIQDIKKLQAINDLGRSIAVTPDEREGEAYNALADYLLDSCAPGTQNYTVEKRKFRKVEKRKSHAGNQ